jgi:chaperone BCS1
MTTNHIEKLDPAILRAGRSDVQVKINNASEKQIKVMYNRFYPDMGAEQA